MLLIKKLYKFKSPLPAWILIIFVFFIYSIGLSQTDFSNFSTINGISYSNFSSIDSYGIVRKGAYLVFMPYTGINISKNNKLTFVKPQTPIKVIAKLKNQPFYFCEVLAVEGFLKEENFTYIDQESLNFLLSLDTLYLKKPLLINDILFSTTTELRYLTNKKGSYEVYIWDGRFYKAYLKSKYVVKKLKPIKENYKKVLSYFKGSPYFWAGSELGWDCSLLVKDFYKLFDIEMPRNSFQQITSVEHIDVSNLSTKEKIKILKRSKPYETLLYFPGHIMVFSGFKGKEPMSFQALNRFNNKKYGRVDYFPLLKTGLLQKVSKIGYVKNEKLACLTNSVSKDKIKDREIE